MTQHQDTLNKTPRGCEPIHWDPHHNKVPCTWRGCTPIKPSTQWRGKPQGGISTPSQSQWQWGNDLSITTPPQKMYRMGGRLIGLSHDKNPPPPPPGRDTQHSWQWQDIHQWRTSWNWLKLISKEAPQHGWANKWWKLIKNWRKWTKMSNLCGQESWRTVAKRMHDTAVNVNYEEMEAKIKECNEINNQMKSYNSWHGKVTDVSKKLVKVAGGEWVWREDNGDG